MSQTRAARRAPVTMLSVGGTIFMAEAAADGRAVPDAAAAQRLSASTVDGVELTAEAIANTSSSDVRPAHLREVLARARAAVDGGAVGVVLTHGTDTLEESAFLLGLHWDREEPLAVTGAMRPASAPGADGPANLRDAAHTAASQTARGLGALVVFDGHAHLAAQVVKASSRSLAAFRSEPSGPVGRVDAGQLQLLHRPLPAPPPLTGAIPDRFPAVPLLTAGLDEDFTLLDHLPPQELRGLVIAGSGMGHVSPAAMPRLRALIAREVPVVVASRTWTGGTSCHHYAYPGSEVDLLESGAVMAGALPGPKARLLLQGLLAEGAAPERIAEAFAAFAP